MAFTPGPHFGARLVAWAGFAIGSLVSVAGNWLAAWLATPENPNPAPTAATQAGAAVWPIALLIAIEVLSRTPWKAGWHWVLVRVGGVGVVALGSAVISYGHIHAVLRSWGYDAVGAGVGPLVIDGLMTVSGFALLVIGQHAAETTALPGGQEAPVREVTAKPKREAPAKVAAAVVPASALPSQETPPAAAPLPAAGGATPAVADEREAPALPTAPPAREGTGWEALASALPKDSTDEQVWEAIRAYREETGSLPTTNLVKTRMGTGTSRASRLLRDVDAPSALHAVREATA